MPKLSTPQMKEVREVGKAIIDTNRMLFDAGLDSPYSGNISARLSNTSSLAVITPRGLFKPDLTVERLSIIDLDSVVLDKPSDKWIVARVQGSEQTSEWQVHAFTYLQGVDASAIVHAHPTTGSVAFGLAGGAEYMQVQDELSAYYYGDLVVVRGAAGSEDLGFRTSQAFGKSVQSISDWREPYPTMVLMQGHGTVAIGTKEDPVESLHQAVGRVISLEQITELRRQVIKDIQMLFNGYTISPIELQLLLRKDLNIAVSSMDDIVALLKLPLQYLPLRE